MRDLYVYVKGGGEFSVTWTRLCECAHVYVCVMSNWVIYWLSSYFFLVLAEYWMSAS